MTWSETNRYYSALRVIEAELQRTGDGALPWRAEYAEIFGDRAGLLLALRRRWQVLVQAQIEDPLDDFGRPSADLHALAAKHRGLLAALDRDAGRPAGSALPDALNRGAGSPAKSPRPAARNRGAGPHPTPAPRCRWTSRLVGDSA